jgi:hypothetical protein
MAYDIMLLATLLAWVLAIKGKQKVEIVSKLKQVDKTSINMISYVP